MSVKDEIFGRWTRAGGAEDLFSILKSGEGLVATSKQVTRNGKTFQQIFWERGGGKPVHNASVQTDLSSVERARKFAVAAHGGQTYGEGVPYVTHLDAVHETAERLGAPEHVKTAAHLHDVLEDTAVTKTELEAEFGPEVAKLVDAVSNGTEPNRKERHATTYPKIMAAGPDARLLKLCDRIANVKASKGPGKFAAGKLAMYRKEHKAFKTALKVPGEHEAAWNELERLME